MNKDIKYKIAVEFAAILKEWIGYDNLKKVVTINETPEYENLCALHNYCDPNQAMIDAFQRVLHREPAVKELKTTDSVWSLAKKNKFWIV
jgi:UDP-N-acetyl-D-mannosaminuronic acid transferase (WecB/TagA/CpsF family)